MRAIEAKGYKVKLGQHVLSQHRELAGNDDQRINDLLWALRDPDIRGIFFSRGGYGSSRLLNILDRRGIGKQPKLLVGFSDTTAIQWAMWKLWQWRSLSGPLVAELGGKLSTDDEDTFWKVAQGNIKSVNVDDTPVNVVKHGEAKGVLLPGCLTLICNLLGTPYLPELNGAILVIEDIGEAPFRIDRMLVHLKNAGVFDQIGALIVGQFLKSDAKTKAISQSELHQRLSEILDDFPGPIITGFPYGHGTHRLTLPIGLDALISTDLFHFEIVNDI
jgi:muramoyltetrapeptide carboxypeptidase